VWAHPASSDTTSSPGNARRGSLTNLAL